MKQNSKFYFENRNVIKWLRSFNSELGIELKSLDLFWYSFSDLKVLSAGYFVHSKQKSFKKCRSRTFFRDPPFFTRYKTGRFWGLGLYLGSGISHAEYFSGAHFMKIGAGDWESPCPFESLSLSLSLLLSFEWWHLNWLQGWSRGGEGMGKGVGQGLGQGLGQGVWQEVGQGVGQGWGKGWGRELVQCAWIYIWTKPANWTNAQCDHAKGRGKEWGNKTAQLSQSSVWPC